MIPRKLLLIFFSVVCFCDASQLDNENLRGQLALVNTEVKDETYTVGFSAYTELLSQGCRGFELLSNSWLQDEIPEGYWLDWSYDFLTRMHPDDIKEHKRYLSDYHSYFAHRLEADKVFSKSVFKKLLSDDVSGDEFLIYQWLRGEKGYRLVGYKVLKYRYPEIPSFNYSGEISIREKELLEIERYMNRAIKK